MELRFNFLYFDLYKKLTIGTIFDNIIPMINEITPQTADIIKKPKTVSHSQFSNWFTCSFKWYRDYILHEKEFEDNLIMSFGTAIHETVQHYLQTLYQKSEKEAELIDTTEFFKTALNKQITLKKIPHTP